MKFAVDWHDLADNSVPEERATVADLQISVGNTNICDHAHDGARGAADHVTVSVYPVAEGIALDWWSIFGRRGDRYRLMNRRGGYVIPDIFMRFDGAAFEFGCSAFRYRNPPMWFTHEASEILPREKAERELSDFLEQTIEQLKGEGISESELQSRWSRVQASLEDADEAAFCEAAGALGLDPYDLSQSEAEAVLSAGRLFQ